MGMNDQFVQCFDTIDERITGLETSSDAITRQIADLQASHTQHDQQTTHYFDDMYVMNNDNHHY